ncbi:MAG: hypothetical protein R3C68_14150 [Myxococcota bacterium]
MRTRRALLISAIYLGLAALGGSGMFCLFEIEKLKFLGAQNSPNLNHQLMNDAAYQKVLAMFSDVPVEALAPVAHSHSASISVVLSAACTASHHVNQFRFSYRRSSSKAIYSLPSCAPIAAPCYSVKP